MENKISHIYWFASYNLSSASIRYRGKYPLDHLKKNYNTDFDFVFPSRSINGLIIFLRVFFSALLFRKSNSLIVIQKICTNNFYANALKILILIQRKNTLYDIDDAEHLRNKTKTLHFFLKNCESISVGSHALLNYCLKFNKNVFLQTSPIPNHGKRKKRKKEKLSIGWVGDFGNGNKIAYSFSHKTSLYELFFSQIQNINYPIKLILIGIKNPLDIPEIISFFKHSPNIEIEIPTGLDWENDDWLYPKISEFDIGISPMLNHPFNEAKSAFKAKQYLSCGVPVIASDVGENSNFVLHNFNGIICAKREEFIHAINFFSSLSEDEYLKMSKHCLENIGDYSMDNYCKRLIQKSIE